MAASLVLDRSLGLCVRAVAGNDEPDMPEHCCEPIPVGPAIESVPDLFHHMLCERPLVSARDFSPPICRNGRGRYRGIASQRCIFVPDATRRLFCGALRWVHGVSWRGGTDASERGITDGILFLHCDGWRCWRNCSELGSPLVVPQLLGVSSRRPGVHGGRAVCLSARTFFLVVHRASFAGAADSRRRGVTGAKHTCSLMERGGAVSAIDRCLRGRSPDRCSRFQICDGASHVEDCSCRNSSPQCFENRFGIAHGRLGDSAKGRALPRHRFVEKFLWCLVGIERRRRELFRPAVRRYRSWVPVSGPPTRSSRDGLLRPKQRSKHRDSRLASASHARRTCRNGSGHVSCLSAIRRRLPLLRNQLGRL